MGICYVVGAGDCSEIDFKIQKEDMVIAADAGYLYLKKAGIAADIVVGDFDSMKTVPNEKNIVKLKPEKDVTDMSAAVSEGIKKGFKEFVLYGATGGRIDHTFANIQLIASLAEKGFKASLRSEKSVVTAISNGRLNFDSTFKGYISVFAHSNECRGVFLEGLKYPLNNAVLKNTFPLGVSNEFLGIESSVCVQSGTLIVVYSL